MLEQIIWGTLHEAARHALEAMMDFEKVKAVSPFYREGRQEGREEVLRRWVLDLCDALGIVLAPAERERLEAMGEGELEALRRELKQTRRWPG